MAGGLAAMKGRGTKMKKPTAAIDGEKLKKMYLHNTDVDPTLSAVCVARCLSYHVQMMVGEYTAQNDSMFPGNMENKSHEYGKEVEQNRKAELSANTKSMFLPTKINRDELIIIMNSDMYKELKSAVLVNDSSEAGAYNEYIKQFMEFDSNIIKLDTMPYGAFKIGSKYRYNI